MKRSTSMIAAVLLASGVAASSQAFSGSMATAEPAAPARAAIVDQRGDHGRDFDRFLVRYEAANSAVLNGDPTLWLDMATEREPASIFGGFGGLGDVGAADVHRRYLLAAGAFLSSGAEVDIEYLVKDVQGRIAYTVAIERAEVLYAGHADTQPQVLRVTMMFRYERGDWKIVHRHADMMVDLQLPTP